MKKIIKRFWGVGLILMLLSTLFIAATPVSAADPLNWEMKTDAPSGAVGVLAPGTDILDYVVAPGGMTMFAAVTSAAGPTLVQTTFGGGVWTNIGPTAAVNRLPASIVNVSFVAMAPDDPNYVVVADAVNGTVAISINGGASFSDLGVVAAGTTLSGIEISALATAGARYIAAFGASAGAAVIYYRNLGGFGGWANAVTAFTAGTTQPIGLENIEAFQFSPNFPSDYMAVAVSEDTNVAMKLHVLSFNSNAWDGTVAANYPVAISTNASVASVAVNKAAVALDPSYMGGDESTRIAFVGASITKDAAEAGNLWRCIDYAPAQTISSTRGYASVAFDGTNLAAGSYATNKVYRSADPLAASPTLLASRSLKDIGIDDTLVNDQVQVMFVGETLYGAKLGIASAISKSLDYGNIWNDFTLLDSGSNAAFALGGLGFFCGPGTIDDILVAEAGDPWYLAAHTTADNITSIYRMAMFGVTRVLCLQNATNSQEFILRGVAADPNMVYAADEGGTTIYYSGDGGLSRWQTRLNTPNTITDLAVESATVIYIGSGVNVYKSSNAGFTWGLGVNTKVSGNIARMLTLGENKLVVSSGGGSINYSTDGGASWVATFSAMSTGPVASHIAATGLGTGDYIFAAPGNSNAMFRCEISPANFLGEFKTMNMVAPNNTEVNTGVSLRNGILYAVSSNGTTSVLNSTAAPTIPGTHAFFFWRTRFSGDPATADFALTPSALKTSKNADGSIRLMSVDQDANSVYYFDDTVALVGPKLNSPKDKMLVQILSQIAGNAQPVTFTWDRLSKSTGYQVWIGLDPMFTSSVAGSPFAAGVGAPVDSFTWAAAVPGNTYYWKIVAVAPMTSASSETRSFVVQPTAASVPTIASPENGSTVTTTKPAFSWSPVSGATMYEFQLSEGTAFAAPVYATQVANAGVQLPLNVTLEQGKTYFWRVRAFLPVPGDWSTIANITIAMPAPPAPAPTPPVVVQQMPAPIINIPAAPPAQQIVIPPAPAEKVINPTYIWAIIIIGAVLVIAVIVLIVRTRRTV